MNGDEVARALGALPDLAQPAMVAPTGWGDHNGRARTREAGFDHHLIKLADLGTAEQLLNGVKNRR